MIRCLRFGRPARRPGIALLSLLVAAHLAIVGSVALSGPASGAGSADYNSGLKAYQARNYKLAAQYFQASVTGAQPTALGWLYLGHSYLGSGDTARAIEAYKSLADKFPQTAEAQLAIDCMIKLKPSLAAKYHPAPAAAIPATNKAAEGRKETLIDRIVIYPPKFGHPAVSREMAQTVREVVQKIPRHMYQYLSDGGATINLVPNIEDKWPGSGDGIKPTDTSSTMGEEPGRTYGHDVHIYEREKVRGSQELKEARSQSEISRVCFHELGHAVDAVAGEISKSPQFMAALNSDLNGVPDSVKSSSSYYTAPGEAFAETTGVLMGNPDGNAIVEYYRSVKTFIKNKFHL